jgi:hypothetical protein
MPRKKNSAAAARAREGLAASRQLASSPTVMPLNETSNHDVIAISSDSDRSPIPLSESEDSSEDELEQLWGQELSNSVMAEAQAHQHAFEKLMVVQSEGYWAKAERSLPRGTQTGQAPHTLNEHKQYLHEKSVTDEISQKR